MKHQPRSSSQDKILETVKREFSRFHKEVGGHCPPTLKSLAISAVNLGLSYRQVAQAAGVTSTSIANWVSRVPKAKQLRVIESVQPTEIAPSREINLNEPLICIRLVSGIEIDFPRSEFSFEFLSMLNNAGGSR